MTILFDMLSEPKHFYMEHPVSAHVFNTWNGQGFEMALANIEKYRVSMEVMDLAFELEASLPEPVFDGKAKWLEFGNKMSMVGMLISDENAHIVIGMSPIHKIWHDVAFKPDGSLAFPADLSGPTLKDRAAVVSLIKGRKMLLKALALIQQPRIVETARKTYDLPLQHARVRSGKRPLTEHSEVIIHVTKREKEARVQAEQAMRAGKRLHLVRAHYKASHGRVIRIAEYWRGDASLGVKHTNTYRVKL